MKRSCLLLVSGAISIFGVAAPAFADEPTTGSTDFTVTVNPYLNLTITSADMSADNIISLPLIPSSGGTYGSKSLTATASTNNAYGYTLVMSTPHTYLESDTINVNDGTNPHIEAITSRNGGRTATEFADNVYDDMNKWGISIDNITSYNPIALTQNLKKVTTPVADSATVVNMATVLDLLTPPGSYSTTLNFELVANATTGSLEQALIDAGKEKVTVGNNKYYKIQDVNTAICNTTTDTTSTLEVVDIRDNTIYHIGKLADNRCWLLDNLALDLTATDASTNVTTANTNADQTSLDALFGTTTRNASTDPDGNLATAGVVSWTSSSSYYSAPLSYATLKDNVNSSDSISELRSVKYGVFYNYCAASAGSYCYGDGSNEGSAYDRPNTAIDTEYDICPSGWRMPTGNTYDETSRPDGGEYQAIINAITGGTSTYINDPDEYAAVRKTLRLPLSGSYDYGSASDQTYNGYFWSSTYDGPRTIYAPNISTSDVYPQYSYPREYGRSVRCLVK